MEGIPACLGGTHSSGDCRVDEASVWVREEDDGGAHCHTHTHGLEAEREERNRECLCEGWG